MANSLEQYIALFETYRSTIESYSPAVLNARRGRALEFLKNLGDFPKKGDEGFPKISLQEMFGPDYGLNLTRLSMDDYAKGGSGKRCLPTIMPRTIKVINDSLINEELTLPEGVEVCSLRDAAEKYPEIFEKEIAPADNPIVALNDLLVQDGVFVKVSKDVNAGRPIQIVSQFKARTPIMGVRRIIVDVEEGAKVSLLLCEHPDGVSSGNAAGKSAEPVTMSCRVVEARVGRNAGLDIYDLEEADANARRASVVATSQDEGSRLTVCGLFLNGGQTRNEFYPRFEASGCEARLGGLVIGKGSQVIDNSVVVEHTRSHCSSEQLFKYALFDRSQGSFEGMVKVAEGAVHTDAHQTNRNILGSEDARMYAMPQLEIYCDEVKASHGSATGRLDEKALFYMRSRGIPEGEARMMLVNAFMTDVLDMIDDEAIRERLHHLVDMRLRGEEAVCGGCAG